MDTPTNESTESNFKHNFEQILTEYEQQHPGTHRKPWTNERIIEVINKLKKARVAMNSKSRRTPMDYYWMSKYDTMIVNDKECLILKRKSAKDLPIRIIPREDYFDELMKIHDNCGHGGRDKMLRNIKSKFYIPKKAIEVFVYFCPVCDTKRNIPKKTVETQPTVSQDFNLRGQVNILDFQSCPDGEYKWLLNYQDTATKFLSFRPLKTKQSNEVATELLKIFLIFGAPYILQSDCGREFTSKVIKELSAMWPECKIVHGSLRTIESQGNGERSNHDVKKLIQSWMSDNNSTNWSVGCYFAQYQINASSQRLIGRSPYKALFGSEPKAGLSSSTIPPSSLMNIQTEEQLINLSEQQFDDNMFEQN